MTLTDFEGRDVIGIAIIVRNTGDGLSEAVAVRIEAAKGVQRLPLGDEDDDLGDDEGGPGDPLRAVVAGG